MSEFLDWIDGASAWEVFRTLDVALLLLALVAASIAVAALLREGGAAPLGGRAVTACGAIATTIVLIFLDTKSAAAGAVLALVGAVAMLAGGLLLDAPARGGTVLTPPYGDPGTGPPPPGWYPDPQGRAPLRFWDGAGWTERTQG